MYREGLPSKSDRRERHRRVRTIQVSEKKELAVLDVFNVTDKQCKMLRKEIEEKKRFGEPKQIYFKKLEQKNERK